MSRSQTVITGFLIIANLRKLQMESTCLFKAESHETVEVRLRTRYNVP